MKTILRLALLAVVIATGFWLWTILVPSPEKLIRKQLGAIARDASSNPNQNPLVKAAKAQKLAGYFTTNIEVRLDVPNHLQQTLNGRDEITQTAGAVFMAANGIKVEFLDVVVTVGIDKQSATAELTLKAQVGDDKDFVVQEMKFTLEKIDGEWLVSRVETVRPLT